MVDVLVILDGASEPPRGHEPTSLELARTPALDLLARDGELTRLRTIAPGLAPGSEAAIPALLGWTPSGCVDRAALEAAAYGIEVPEGARAWRVDVLRSGAGPEEAADCAAPVPLRGEPMAALRAEAAAALQVEPAAVLRAAAVAALRAGAPGHCVHALRGHRYLLVGPPPLPAAALAAGLRVWPEGVVPPSILGVETVLVGARGAAVGAACLMGAATVVPAGATGLPRSDLAAKAAAAIAVIGEGAARVVVHVGGPDEAAHLRDQGAKVAAIGRADREVVGPLTAAVRSAGGTLTVCPDHGCDPHTGKHDAAPVPCVTWSPADTTLRRELQRAFERRRLTERAVSHLAARVPAVRAFEAAAGAAT